MSIKNLSLIVMMVITLLNTAASANAAEVQARPRVIAFTNSWAEPCRQIEPVLEQAQKDMGDQIEFVEVDADDPQNQALLEKYEVAPVPTVVYLNGNGDVVNYQLGFSGAKTVKAGLQKLLPSS